MDEPFFILEGHELSAAREQLGLSIDDLARRSGQAASVLVAWETAHG
jgi:DNA-binding transcriptional regulator YiaG